MNFKHIFLLTAIIIIIVPISTLTSNQIPKPQQRKVVTGPPKQVNILKGQSVDINFPNFGYIVGVKIEERVNNPRANLVTVYEEQYSSFNKSQFCDIIDPEISMTQIVSQDLEGRIIQYYADKETKQIFLTTQKDIRIYRLTHENITLIKSFPIIQDYKDQKITFIKFIGKMFITNGYSLYQFKNQNNPDTAQLILWTTVPQDEAINNIKINKQSLIHIKIVRIGSQHLLFLYERFYIIYKYDAQANNLKFLPCKFTLDQLKMNQGFFVDVIQDKLKLYLLNNQMGILQLQNFHPDDPKPLIINQFQIQYGELVKFKKFGSVFQIICQYKRKRFVAEMLLQQTIGKDRSLILNRFYHKVEGAHEVAMFNQHLHIYGEDQVHLYGPAINRFTLFQQKQYPYIFSNHGINQFAFFSNSQKVHESMDIIGINEQSISFLKIKTQQISLKCKPDTDIQLRLNILSSCCQVGEPCQQQIVTICNHLQDLQINVTNSTSALEAILIVAGIVLTLVVVAIGIIGFCCKGFKDIKKQLSYFSDEIKARIKGKSTNLQEKDKPLQQQENTDAKINDNSSKKKQQVD